MERILPMPVMLLNLVCVLICYSCCIVLTIVIILLNQLHDKKYQRQRDSLKHTTESLSTESISAHNIDTVDVV